MALLYRYVKLHDRADSHVFTFVVTRSVTRDPERDVTSKELTCNYQRWAITFSRTDKVLGVYLVWKSASQGMRVYVDFTFTLLNREHFSCNEAFSGKQVLSLPPLRATKSHFCIRGLYAVLGQERIISDGEPVGPGLRGAARGGPCCSSILPLWRKAPGVAGHSLTMPPPLCGLTYSRLARISAHPLPRSSCRLKGGFPLPFRRQTCTLRGGFVSSRPLCHPRSASHRTPLRAIAYPAPFSFGTPPCNKVRCYLRPT